MKYLLHTLAITGLAYFLIAGLNKNSISTYHPTVDRSGGPADVLGQDRTGGPLASGVCNGCHGGGSFETSYAVEVTDAEDLVVSSYVPGEEYTIAYTVTSTVGIGGGFGMQSVILDPSNNQAGTFLAPTTPNTQLTVLSGRTYIEHDGAAPGGTSYVYSAPWIAPVEGTGNVTIYGIGMTVNGTGSTSGDDPSPAGSFTLNEEVEPDITYLGSPYCDNEGDVTPIIEGDEDGVFTSDAGLDINPSTGVISPSTSDIGLHTITYTYGEPEEELSQEIEILESFATETTAAICTGDTLLFGDVELTASDEGENTFAFTAINSCDSIVTLTLTVHPLPDVTAIASDESICLGDSVTLTSTGTGITYTWEDGVEEGIPFAPTELGETTYTVTAIDVNSCENTSNVSVIVNEVELSSVVTVVVLGDDGEIDLTVSGGTPPYTFDWNNDETGDFDDEEDLTMLNEGEYIIIVEDADGCTATDTIVVDLMIGGGIAELNGSKILIYPNPVNNEFTLELEGRFSYEVTALDGKSILKGNGLDKTFVELKNIPEGTYLVKIEKDQYTKTLRIIKN